MSQFTWRATNAPDVSKTGRTDDIWFVDQNRGWAVNSNAQILFTSDGGTTWTEQHRVQSRPATYLRCVTFGSSTDGWVGSLTSANRLFKTQDGGNTWSRVENLPDLPSAICGLYAVDEKTIYGSGTNFPNRPPAVIKSTDGGESWTLIDMQRHASLLVDIYFPTPEKGWVVGGVGGRTRDKCKPVILHTQDGGASWVDQLQGADIGLKRGEWGWKVQFIDSDNAVVSLENFDHGAILKTDDGGASWTRLEVNDPQKNANLEGIGFLDEQHGWVGGWGDRNFETGFTSVTHDGGQTWQNANEVGLFINRFRFVGPSHARTGYASGGTVYKYADHDLPQFASDAPRTEKRDALLSVRESTKDILSVSALVARGSRAVSLDVWDRFGEHLGEIGALSLPEQGVYSLNWDYRRPNGSDAGEGPFIYRLDLGDHVESGFLYRTQSSSPPGASVSNFRLMSDDEGIASPETMFLAATDADGQAEPLPLPTVDEEREAFFKVANIEDFPEFRSRAKELALAYLSNVDYSMSPFYAQFAYTEAAFDERMKAIYDAVLPGMYEPHAYDRDVIGWSNGKRYRVGRASDAVVRDRILQFAPFNLMDGVWLQNILQAGPSDAVQSKLFDIWADEVGNGEISENHSNVYEDLLRSQGLYLPPVTSREFVELDLAPGAWRAPVFQQTIGLFPQTFFPELLGMTLFLEWEATPTLMPTAKMLEGRGINPLFYSLHVAIDNISEGHGALAKDAVKIYLDEKREEGGERAVQEHWVRIWNGYVGWATAGFNGAGMQERRLLLDKKRINVGTPETPECFPDFKGYYAERMKRLIERKSFAASTVHGRHLLDGVLLNSLFANPVELMNKMVSSGLVDIAKPRHSRLFELMEFGGPMYRVFTDADKDVIYDWLESLSDTSTDECIDPVPDDPGPTDWPKKMHELIRRFARVGRRGHDRLVLTDASGAATPLNEFFDDPVEFMRALVRSGWVVPGAPDRSMFLTRILENGGPMQGELGDNGVEIVREWIRGGAAEPIEVASQAIVSFADSDSRDAEFRIMRPFIGQGAVH